MPESSLYSRRGDDTKELRGDAPADLVRALDALAMVEDKTRHQYCLEILSKHVALQMHRLSLLNSMLAGNPLVPESNRRVP